MVAALGGALYFGAIRRLWERISWQNSVYAAAGLVILANSRPLEGMVAVTPVTAFFLFRSLRLKRMEADRILAGAGFTCRRYPAARCGGNGRL